MLQLKNSTPFAGMLFLAPDPDGIDSVYTVIKGTFTLGTTVTVAPAQLPVSFRDIFHGDPATSSLQCASDFSLMKPGTDVLLVGSAHAPQGRPVRQMDVSLRVGPVNKTLRVIGNRVLEGGLLAYTASQPEPFAVMPLTWERAYGGIDQKEGSPEVFGEKSNPVGTGFYVRGGQKKVDGMALPNLQYVSDSGMWKGHVAPACFGPTLPHWEPRCSFAGTYDAHWLKNRMPFLPEDFDARFFQVAPADQICPSRLRGGEAVEIVGVHPRGTLRFALPHHRVEAHYALGRKRHSLAAPLDTVLFEPDAARLVLVWRTALPCDKKALRVSQVEITASAEQREDG